MQLCLTLDHRFLQTPDNRVWTVTQCAYSFFAEYLEVFDQVRVIARSFPVAEVKRDFLAVEGPGVEFYPVASYKGPYQYIARYQSVRRSVRDAVPEGSAVLFRVPSQVANSVEKSIRGRGWPYGIEVVADPYDVLSPAANPHPLAPIARYYFMHSLKARAKRAAVVSYVTQYYLQQRYPPRGDAFVARGGLLSGSTSGLETDVSFPVDKKRQYAVGVSDANLSEECFRTEPRTGLREPGTLRALFIGTLESLYKGPDTLIRAVALCRGEGVRVEVRFAGSGKQIAKLQALCSELHVSDRVTFLGNVQVGGAVRAEIDRADVLVLPSRAEGVPRAMLEAMARSLPCLGSHAGGIPELLDEEDRVAINDAAALAAKLRELVLDPKRMERMSRRNLRTARMYTRAVLRDRRRRFLEVVRQSTADYFMATAKNMVAVQPPA